MAKNDHKAKVHTELNKGTYLTPEPEVLHFSFKIPDIGYLWAIFTVRKDKQIIHFLK